MELGQAIKKARQAKGMTQGQLAEIADCATIQIIRYESGKMRPAEWRLFVIADALNMEVNKWTQRDGDGK